MRHFTGIESLSKEELYRLLELSEHFRKNRYQNILKNKTLITMFFNPSTRTKTSFDLAVSELGGHCVTLEPGKSSWGIEMEEGAIMDGDAEEHLKDAVKVLSRYGDFIGVRCFPKFVNWEEEKKDLILKNMVKWADVPIVNMETITHPCQALAMLMTIKEFLSERKKKKFVLTWAYHPKPLNTAVANSAGMAAAFYGMDVVLAHPPGYDLDPFYVNFMKEKCRDNHCSFEICNDMDKAFEDADFIYAKSWGALSQYGNFQPEIHQQYKDWIVNEERMMKTNNGFFSHCLPLRRNMIASDGVLDSENSLIYEEAENRLHVQKAVLSELNREWNNG